MTEPVRARRVVVVTGGAAGLGAAIAEELGRTGAFVVTLDRNVSVDGTELPTSDEPTTADRIIRAGGAARAVKMSVTDAAGVTSLFQQIAADFGTLDAVVNAAGISRPTSFAGGDESDWDEVLRVHVEGYLNVLRAALPIMAAAGRGSIVGMTSGSGWRGADTGAYGCAKRAVAAITWQLGKTAPPGVTVNALSPIAATRMVTAALARTASGGETSKRATAGGITLSGFPPAEHLGPVGAYLAGDQPAWCRGRVVFSGGAEIALVAEPQLIEVVRSRPVAVLADALAEVIPEAFVPAELSQSTGGGSTARFATAFDASASPSGVAEPASGVAEERDRPGPTCVVVTDDARLQHELIGTLHARGVVCASVGEPADGFVAALAQLRRAIAQHGPLDSVVLAIGAPPANPVEPAGMDAWKKLLADHDGIARQIRADAAWMRAVADDTLASQRAARLVVITRATTPAGHTRAQAAAQLSRAARGATNDLVSACAVSYESEDELDRSPLAELVAHLVVGPDTKALSGAELCVGSGWFGLRSHPRPAGTVTYGGPALPGWVDAALRELVEGEPVVRSREGS